MSTVARQALQFDPLPADQPRIGLVEGWRLREFAEVDSTNLVAARLSAWDAVRADAQTAGRGRFQREWISDAGGLWLSAVVPVHSKTAGAGVLPLVVGLAVCDALSAAGVTELRMRWPNDVLVGNRKLAGLLIERFNPDMAVAGIGVNVSNEPEARDERLKHQTARLADLVFPPPSLLDLTALILRQLRLVVDELNAGNVSVLLPRINQLWGWPRPVELDLDGEFRAGTFNGVDDGGRLILSGPAGGTHFFEPWQVRHLRETKDQA